MVATLVSCPNPKCRRKIPRSLLACKSCWFSLPKALRDKVWRHYQPKQEEPSGPAPTPEYYNVLKEAIAFWNKPTEDDCLED